MRVFFYGGDDVDLGRRAKAAGIKVFYYPKVNIVHVGKLTASKRAWRSDYYHHLGMWLYYVKWAGLLGFFLSPLVFAGIWGRFLLRRFYTPRVGF